MTNPTLPQLLSEMKKRCDEATPGPFIKSCHGPASGLLGDNWWSVDRAVHDGRCLRSLGQIARCLSLVNGANDASFFTHARTDLPRALDALNLALLELTLPDVLRNPGNTVKEIRAILAGEK